MLMWEQLSTTVCPSLRVNVLVPTTGGSLTLVNVILAALGPSLRLPSLTVRL